MPEFPTSARVSALAVDTDPEASSAIAPSRQAAWPQRILVATNGSRSSNDAILAARVLADRSGASVEIAAVYAPHIAVPGSATRHGSDQCEGSERVEAASLLNAVRKQCRDSGHARRHWPVRLEVGDPSSAIVHLAKDIGADLVMLGIGHREPAYRWIGGHTSMRVARYLAVPLYASAFGCESPVRCIVLSNGIGHEAALRAATACVTPGGHIWVAVAESAPMNAGAFEAAASGVEIEPVEVEGDMLSGVLRVADDVGAQLIVVPNHGDPGPTRAFLPNLAEPLLLAARCSVLAVPDQLETAAPSEMTAPRGDADSCAP